MGTQRRSEDKTDEELRQALGLDPVRNTGYEGVSNEELMRQLGMGAPEGKSLMESLFPGGLGFRNPFTAEATQARRQGLTDLGLPEQVLRAGDVAAEYLQPLVENPATDVVLGGGGIRTPLTRAIVTDPQSIDRAIGGVVQGARRLVGQGRAAIPDFGAFLRSDVPPPRAAPEAVETVAEQAPRAAQHPVPGYPGIGTGESAARIAARETQPPATALPEAPTEAMVDPFAKQLREGVAALDAMTPEQRAAKASSEMLGSTDDAAYRGLLSTGGKTPLKRGETWRERALRFADDADARAQGASDPVRPTPPEVLAPQPITVNPQTRQPATVRTFRGSGRADPEALYEERAQGVGGVLGPGRYSAFERSVAERFGPDVEETTVSLRNPLVIRSDNEWRPITRAAGLEFPNPLGMTTDDTRWNVQQLRRYIEGQGYDGVIVQIPDWRTHGDAGKLLRDVFGDDQVVEFRPTARVAQTAPAPAPPIAPVASVAPPVAPPPTPVPNTGPAPYSVRGYPGTGPAPYQNTGPATTTPITGATPPVTPPTPPVPRVPHGARPATKAAPKKRRLTDLQDITTQVNVAFQPNMARRLGEKVADVPGLKEAVRLANPTLGIDSAVGKAAVGRAMLREEGYQKIEPALFSWIDELGTMDSVFGPSDPTTGRLTKGVLAGRSVNEIAENPTSYASLTTPQQKAWLDRAAGPDGAETEIKEFLERQGVPINSIPLTEVERYAGRVVAMKVTSSGDLIEAAFIGGPSRMGGRIGAEKARTFATVQAAQNEGFVYMPYEEALRVKARSAVKRVADKKASDYILANLPANVQVTQKQKLDFGDIFVDDPAFKGMVFEGPGASEFRRDIESFIRQPPDTGVAKALRGINKFNSIQRVFVLAGDASLFTIQLIAAPVRHPIAIAKTGKEFGQQLATALVNPGAARRHRAKLVSDNNDLLQRMRKLIVSSSGNEYTEALQRGGLLHSQRGLFGKVLAVPLHPLRAFQEAFETAMDTAGINMARGLEHLAGGDAAKMDAIADYVNNMRGLTSSARIGVSPMQQMAESAIFLAPRYRRATAALTASALQGGVRGKLAREAWLSFAVGTVFAYAGFTLALGKQQGKSEQQVMQELKDGLNPSSPRFMLWRVGGSLMGPGSKFISDIRLLAKLATRPDDFLRLADEEGARNPGIQWVRSQLAGAPSTAWDILSGEDYLGEPVTTDWIGDPVKTLQSWSKQIGGENLIPAWVQSMAFEGGTPSERLTRGAGSFGGLRAFPQGKGDVLQEAAFERFNKRYQDLEPYQKQEVKRDPRVTKMEDRRRGALTELDKADAERDAQLDALAKNYGRVVNKVRHDQNYVRRRFYEIERENYLIKKGIGIGGKLKPRPAPGEIDPDASPEERALDRWYALGDEATVDGVFNADALEQLRIKHMNSLGRQVKEYVLRNTNTRPIPANVLLTLPTAKKATISQSEAARRRHRTAKP